MQLDVIDRIGLIREAYRIEGISAEQCRSIFVDWALKLPADIPQTLALQTLFDIYGAPAPDHPMTQVLREGLNPADTPRRRGGRAARMGASVPKP